jgi:tRNA pseudouridine55 synthase
MSRRRKGRNVHGILLLDKPEGYSSSQAVQKVRWLFQARKAGHTGALDPFATGMLPVCLGEASKTAGFMMNASKTYVARAVLGQSTTSGDIEGDLLREEPVPKVDDADIREVFAGFLGETDQIPPMYSALKHKGQPLYKLARAGKEVSRPPRTITIHSLELLQWESEILVFRVHCSKGTYIRTLAEDIAAKLGTCAHLQALRRLDVEPFSENGMISLEDLVARVEAGTQDEILLPADAGLENWPRASLDEFACRRFRHGNPVEGIDAPVGLVRVYGPENSLLGIGEVVAGQRLKPKRLMNIEA